MNILINAVLVPEPDLLSSEWVTVAVDDKLYRQLVLSWNRVSAAQAATILGAATADPAGVSLSYLYPVTNANVSYTVKVYAARVSVLREASGEVTYAPLALTLREVIP